MSDKYNLRSRPTSARPAASTEGSVPGQGSGWPGPMSTELDVPMPAQAGVTKGHGGLSTTDLSEGRPEGPQTSPDQVSAYLDSDPKGEYEFDLEIDLETRLMSTSSEQMFLPSGSEPRTDISTAGGVLDTGAASPKPVSSLSVTPPLNSTFQPTNPMDPSIVSKRLHAARCSLHCQIAKCV